MKKKLQTIPTPAKGPVERKFTVTVVLTAQQMGELDQIMHHQYDDMIALSTLAGKLIGDALHGRRVKFQRKEGL